MLYLLFSFMDYLGRGLLDEMLEAKAIYKLKTLPDGQNDPADKTLLFESKFESGNLYLA